MNATTQVTEETEQGETAKVAAKCLACESSDLVEHARAYDIEYRTSEDWWVYRRCLSCGAISIDPVPSDQLREIYPSNYYSFKPVVHSLTHRIKRALDRRTFRKLLSGVQGNKLRVLDVGGGAGWELCTLRDADPRIHETTVVDIDPGAERLARENGHEYWCGMFEEYPITAEQHVVLMLNLIEHVANPREVLEKARAALAPGGIVLIKTPNTQSLDAKLLRRRNWGGYHCPRHWTLFDRASFEKVAKSAGLRVRSLKYTQGAPFWTWSTLRGLERLGLVRVSKERPMYTHPLHPPLAAGFAAFDLARVMVGMKASQMFVELEADR